MKKLLVSAFLIGIFIVNGASSCGSQSDPSPKQDLSYGLVGERWELQQLIIDAYNKNDKLLMTQKWGPGLGYIFNSNGRWDGCAITTSEWTTLVKGTPASGAWQCGDSGTWSITNGSNSSAGSGSSSGTLTLISLSKDLIALGKEKQVYDFYVTAKTMTLNKRDKDPSDGSYTISTLDYARK